MSKRIRESFGTHANLAHVWAQQTYASGHAADRRMFFTGKEIFSYGRHYLIAQFVENKSGKRGVLFNSEGYSVSTAKHRHHVQRALGGLGVPIFEVPGASVPDSKETLAKAKSTLVRYLAMVARTHERFASRKQDRMEDAKRIVEQANRLSEFFGWRWRLEEPSFSAEELAKVKAASDRAIAAKAAKTRKANEAARAALEVYVSEWRKGEHQAGIYGVSYALPTMLLRIKGEQIETSLGAVVPLEHAKRAWPLLQAIKAKGESWQSNGHTIPIGHYKIERIESDGTIIAGCHRIAFCEVEGVAKELGLI